MSAIKHLDFSGDGCTIAAICPSGVIRIRQSFLNDGHSHSVYLDKDDLIKLINWAQDNKIIDLLNLSESKNK